MNKLNIISGLSTYHTMKECDYLKDNILMFDIPFSLIDLSTTKEMEVILPKDIYHKEIKYSFKESIDKLKSYIQNNKDIRIWTSHYEINSYLLMLYICNYLQNKDCNIYVVFSDEYNKDCYSPTCMNAPELNKLKDLEHKLNKNEINSYSSKWLDIVNENSDIRLLEDNNVKSVSYDYLNDYILIKLKKLGSTKISKLTIEIMKDYHLIDLLVFYLIRRLINENKIIIVTKNEDNSITYAGKKWYQIAEDDTSTTLVLAENYGTGSYGPYTTINSSYWANSTVKTKVNEFLTDSSIDTECLINDETYGYVRVPYKSELSTNIPNDSATSFWTMDNIDNSYVVVGKADGTLYEGWNRVNTTPVTTVGLFNGNYSGGPHGSVNGGQSYLWDRTATISREWGALKFNPFGSASNYDQESTVYYATGGGVEKTVEDVIDCLDSTKSYYSYSWYTSSFSNNVDRETASVCTEVGKKTVYLCHEVACCKYGSKNSSVNGGSTSYSYKDFTYNTFSSCNSTTEYKETNISETIGYRPVIKVKK